jgi:hypothetical protein
MAADLWAVYLIQTDEGGTPLNAEQHAELDLELGPLHVLAVRNVIAELCPIERDGVEGVWMLSEEGEHEDALMLVPAVWEWLQPSLQGTPVACLPSPDVLLVTGSKDPEGIARILEAAQEVFRDAEEPISTALVVRQEGRWLPYTASTQPESTPP